jgi:hypothetical protein
MSPVFRLDKWGSGKKSWVVEQYIPKMGYWREKWFKSKSDAIGFWRLK